jgi:hypothetical protein
MLGKSSGTTALCDSTSNVPRPEPLSVRSMAVTRRASPCPRLRRRRP